MQIGFLPLLTLIFVLAKIFGYIAWSWWLVFAPVLFGAAIAFIFIVGFLAVALWVNKEPSYMKRNKW
jgi:hypothetical protein